MRSQKNAVKNGIANPRDIDTDLVDAYLARETGLSIWL